MRSLQDFEPGAVFETPRRTITEAHRVLFAGITGDGHAPVDAHRRSAGSDEDRIVPGTLVFSFSIGLTYESGIYEDSIVAYLGINRLSQTEPCYLGDTVAVTAEVIEARPSSDGSRGVVQMRYAVRAVDRDREVMTADLAFLVRAEEPADAVAAG